MRGSPMQTPETIGGRVRSVTPRCTQSLVTSA
jgi:hypothetical protein